MICHSKYYSITIVGERIPALMISVSAPVRYVAVWVQKQLTNRSQQDYITASAFVFFVITAFFLKGVNAFAVAPIALIALLSTRTGIAKEVLRHHASFWIFLASLAALTAGGLLAGNPGYQASDLLNLALLGAFFLFVAQVAHVLRTRQILSVIAIVSGASAALSIVLQFASAHQLLDRMTPLGRGGNPIPGAGGFAIALIAIAAICLERTSQRRLIFAILAAAVFLFIALVWTQSRAPILALALALPLAGWLHSRRSVVAILLACGGMWLVISGLVIFEPAVKALFCHNDAGWCRPTYRAEIWGWVRDQIALHPLFGSGPSFRFARAWMTHPHNGLLGIITYYGLLACVAFGVMIALHVRKLIFHQEQMLRFFGVASLIFSFGYMGADLSNPFAFFNMHYLFLWLPLFLVKALVPTAQQDDEAQPRPDSHGLQRI